VPWTTIIKSRRDWETVPNLHDYESIREHFTWEQARQELEGLPHNQGLNIAHEAVDRHANGTRAAHLAIRWLGKNGTVEDFSYSRLNDLTNRFANVLQQLGVGKGDRVFVLAGRIPELYIAALGTFKNRSVFCPLFSAFGPEPIRSRLTIGQAKVLVTTNSLYQRKVAPIRTAIPSLEQVLLIGDDRQPTAIAGTQDLAALMQRASPSFAIGPTDPEDMALLHFTSGTTGTPKGAIHVHQAVVAHHMTGKYALDFHRMTYFGVRQIPVGSPAHPTESSRP
jgi:acetyl-CoA synthetase